MKPYQLFTFIFILSSCSEGNFEPTNQFPLLGEQNLKFEYRDVQAY